VILQLLRLLLPPRRQQAAPPPQAKRSRRWPVSLLEALAPLDRSTNRFRPRLALHPLRQSAWLPLRLLLRARSWICGSWRTMRSTSKTVRIVYSDPALYIALSLPFAL
jgi:hypothetical protein